MNIGVDPAKPGGDRTVFAVNMRFFDVQPTLQQIENEYIKLALNQTSHNVPNAAKILGIGRSTLYRKLKALPKTAADLPNPPEDLCPKK